MGGNCPWLSPTYIASEMPICRKLLLHWAESADAFACESAGSNKLASTAMIATTTSNSIKVNPRFARLKSNSPLFIAA